MGLKKEHMQRQGGVILNVKTRFNNIVNVKNEILRPPTIFDTPFLRFSSLVYVTLLRAPEQE